MEDSKSLLVLGATEYWLHALLKKAGTGPIIKVAVKDLNPVDGDPKHPEHEVSILGPHDYPITHVIVYKQNGKYTVLFGKKIARDAIEAGAVELKNVQLISSPMLKETRKESPAIFQQPAATPPPESTGKSYPAEFTNRPRMFGSHQNSHKTSSGSASGGFSRTRNN